MYIFLTVLDIVLPATMNEEIREPVKKIATAFTFTKSLMYHGT